MYAVISESAKTNALGHSMWRGNVLVNSVCNLVSFKIYFWILRQLMLVAVYWGDRRTCNECFKGQQAYTGHDCNGTPRKFKDNWIGM